MLLVFAFIAVSWNASPTSIALRGIEVPNAIVSQHNAYVRCQDEHFDIRNVTDQRAFEAEVEKSIAACRDEKAALMEQAEKILVSTPDYSDPAERQGAITQSFDGYDELRREMARGGATK